VRTEFNSENLTQALEGKLSMKKFVYLGVLLLTLLTGGFMAYTIWSASPQTADQFVKSGKAYYEQKQYEKAVIQLLNAVRKDPRNREARYLLAQAYEDQKNLNAAALTLTSLLEYYPDDVPANLRLGNIYLSGRSTETFKLAQEISQKVLSKQPENVDALILSGNAFAGIENYRASVEVFEKAVSLDPENAKLFVGLGTTQARQKNFPEAEQAFLKARQVDPKNAGAMISLGNFYRSVGKTAEAEAVFKDAFAAFPSSRDVYIPVANFYYGTGNFEQVERVLKDAQEKGAQNPEPSLILADLYQTRNRSADARKLLLELKEKFPSNIEINARLAVNFMQDQPDRAREEIDEILKQTPNNPIGQILLGELQFFTGQPDRAEETFNKDIAVNSRFPEPHYFLGRIALGKGQIDKSQDHFLKSLALNSNYGPAILALAEVYVSKGKLDDARIEVQKVLQLQPSSLLGRLLKATLDVSQKNYDAADKEFASLAKEQPDNAIIQQRVGLAYQSRGLTNEAEKSFVRALELQPGSYPIARDLAQFYIGSKRPEIAIQRINSIPEGKKQAFHYELLGMAYSEAGRKREAEDAFKKAAQMDPDANADFYLAAEYIQSKRFDDGQRKLDELLKKNPFNASLYAAKGLIAENQGKIEDAKTNYSQALKIDANLALPANSMAYFFAEEGRELQTALQWAQTARRREPENPNYADTLGWVHHKLGNDVLARDQLQFAVAKQPDNPIYQYHLAMVYIATKQTAQAEALLKKALVSANPFPERPLAEAALKQLDASK
jgi:tetratricopeptide (TPR) repeat protein